MALVHFTDDNFDEEVLKSDIPVLVDFFATWCGPCKMLTPIVEELSGKYDGKVKIGKLDVDENPNTSNKYAVQSIPTILLVKGGEVVEKLTGFQNAEALTEKLDALA